MSDWLDHFADSFVKQSAARTTVMGAQTSKSGFGSNISRSSGPNGIAPSPRPVRNPQMRATPKAPKPIAPSISSSVSLPKSFPSPKPPNIKVSFVGALRAAARPVASAFFKGVRRAPVAAWRMTPTSVKTLGLGGLGAYGAIKGGTKAHQHFYNVKRERREQNPALVRQRQLASTYRYGSGDITTPF